MLLYRSEIPPYYSTMMQDFQRLCIRVAVVFFLLGYVSSSTLFQFPNTQLGYADLTLYESSLSEVVELCKPRDNTATSAQWLRLVSHHCSLAI